MKNALILLSTFLLFGLYSCSKTEDFTAAEVEKNCTGDYLKFNDKFYKVCNYELLAEKNSGDKINVQVKFLDECGSPLDPSCELYFPFENIIEIRYQY